MEEQEIAGCLNACGFQAGLRERYLVFAKEGQTAAQLRLLRQQRKRLMEDLHTVQKQVDCIDFIIRRLEQEMERGNRDARIFSLDME